MNHATTDRILYALYCLSRDTSHIDATELARATGSSVISAGEALLALERRGLVDASRARLTMLGLARASALTRAGGGGRPRVDLRHAKPRKAPAMPPIAAGSNEEQRPSKRPTDDDSAEQPVEPSENPLEKPLHKPLYKPLYTPVYG